MRKPSLRNSSYKKKQKSWNADSSLPINLSLG